MADLPPENPYESVNQETPGQLNRYILTRDPEPLQKVMARHDRRLLRTASRFIRCIQMYDAAYDAEDAVNVAWATICQLIAEGKMTSVQDSLTFWKRFFLILRHEITRHNRRYRAAKRGAERFRADWEIRRGSVGAGWDMSPGQGYRLSENPLDGVYANLPPPQDLVLGQLEIDSFLNSLEDPMLRKIFEMRLEEYTAAEIAAQLDLSVRYIEQRMSTIRQSYVRQSDARRRDN